MLSIGRVFIHRKRHWRLRSKNDSVERLRGGRGVQGGRGVRSRRSDDFNDLGGGSNVESRCKRIRQRLHSSLCSMQMPSRLVFLNRPHDAKECTERNLIRSVKLV